MKEALREFLKLLKEILNEKTIAMLVLLAIAIGAYQTQGLGAKEIVIPIVAGICSFVTGYVAGQATATASRTEIAAKQPEQEGE